MAKLQDMLAVCNGSFEKAEQYALDHIVEGKPEYWLDLALLFHARGNLEGMRQSHSEYAKVFPKCERLKFASSWLALHDGDFQIGMKLMEAGRHISCWGSPIPQIGTPVWQGEESLEGKTVLFYGEGGMGDQIVNVRCVKNLQEQGAKVILACNESLSRLFGKMAIADAIITQESAGQVYHDVIVPAMSGPRLCGWTYETLPGDKYLHWSRSNEAWNNVMKPSDGKLRVGLCWAGSPTFEHEQYRKFPHELLLMLSDVSTAELYSLQKDKGDLIPPSNVVDFGPLIRTWEDTAEIIDRLDLVISSCTAVAHLAAAMGKPTWVLVPVMPYYLWAMPGNKSKWYSSVRLFRQEHFGDWTKPLMELRKELQDAASGHN